MASAPPPPPPMLTLTITPDPGFTLNLDQLEGTETLGRPFVYQLTLSSTKTKTDLTSLLGSTVTVTLTNPDKSKRYFNGIVARIAYAGMRSGGRTYIMELRPWIWLLSHRKDCRIFQNKAVFDIITTVCRNAGFSDFTDNRKASPKAGSQTLEYCVQYDESSYDFITRLMEEYGIYYYYTHSDGKHSVVFCDDPSSHASIGAAIPFATRQTGARAVDDHIWQWSSELSVRSGKVTYTDYNFKTSTVPLTASSGSGPAPYTHGDIELFDYPGRYLTASGGQPLTDARLQQLGWQQLVKFGTTNSRRMATGGKFAMSGFYEAGDNTSYTVVEASYTLNLTSAKSDTAAASRHVFSCKFQAIADTVPFRLTRETVRPRIHGAQVARVVTTPTGAATDEVTTDEYGRILVLFPWARPDSPATQTESEQNDQQASCWIRVAQPWAGAGGGGMFIPRVGMEVVVAFLDGDPDRPLVVGCVYNDKNTVPYALPANKTRSTIKTNSSEGGGGFNEIRFEDKKNSEEVFFQAQKDYNKVVLNDETVKITQNTTTEVLKGYRKITVDKGYNSLTVSEGDNSLTVTKGKNTTKVKGDNSLTVETGDDKTKIEQGASKLSVELGDHSVEVKAGKSKYKVFDDIEIESETAKIKIKAHEKITLEVGDNSIVIDKDGITISCKKLDVSTTSGAVSISSGAAMSLTAKSSMSADGGNSMTLKAGSIAIN